MRVVIAEDLALLRDGLERLLRDNGFEVVASVRDGDSLLREIAAHKPDIAVVDIRMLRDGQVLSVEVADDGVGGANPNGGGLSGLRRRIEALDGTLRVASPSGGPTVVRAEMPCG